MIITFKSRLTTDQQAAWADFARKQNGAAYFTQLNGNDVAVLRNIDEVGNYPEAHLIESTMRTNVQYPLTSKAFRDHTPVKVGATIFGNDALPIIAGPCSVESPEQIHTLAANLSGQGVTLLRGGTFKARTSPYSFQGHGLEAAQWMHEAARKYGMQTVTEVLDTKDIEKLAPYCDMFQIGSRNMFNYALLKALSRQPKPIILKRGMQAQLDEWLLAAEYLMLGGNDQVILCERGIRTFEHKTRNTFDISAIPWLKQKTHLPVIADPSHAAGRSELVPSLAKAAAGAGADGIMVEVHPDPEHALSDGKQSLNLSMFFNLIQQLGAEKPSTQTQSIPDSD